jgi:hypothetical protein
MREATVTKLISNLEVLQGYIREANVRILALEEILKEVLPVRYGQYRLLVQKYENDPKTFYPLENVSGLQAALLQDHD